MSPLHTPLVKLSRVALIIALAATTGSSAILTAPGGTLRVEVSGTGSSAHETISIQDHDTWTPALSATGSAVRVGPTTSNTSQPCTTTGTTSLENPQGLLITGTCGSLGTFEQRLTLSSQPDVIAVNVRFALKEGRKVGSVEDRYDFSPGRHSENTSLAGPLDFVWSQDIKSEPDDLIPNWSFKSPVLMMQQGAVFAALMPELNERQTLPVALDLDVTSGPMPWMSYGAVGSQPHGHSYFRRSPSTGPRVVAGFVEYSYSIVASSQPAKLGYRSVVRKLWAQTGHPDLLANPDLQRNAVRPELELFDDWRHEAWSRYADEVYHEFPCGDVQCGTLASNRNVVGDWDKPQPDAWFNSWFQTLRTAYGWYSYGHRTGDHDMQRKAENVLNLALTSPQQGGAFATIYLLNDKRWVRDDGWAGFQNAYHAFCMSWTAYWMLRWADDLVPNRKSQIYGFVKPYGDFLLAHQLPSGVIPSWYNADGTPRPEFREFNAETAGSALFLTELARQTGEDKYRHAAEEAMQFVTREVLPRQRWFDFETFKSCARKNFGFYDRWTAQFPQNNLSTIQAAKAYLALYRLTNKSEYLEQGKQVLDYLLLTQQVWNNSAFTPKLLGGFTTQNTDAEWSDARQCYVAILLWDYYNATGEVEYLERAVAAARSTFAVAPWENWAHTGYIDEPGALTGFHWSTGSAMTSVEMMSPQLGDAFIDLQHGTGVGFNACSLQDVVVHGDHVAFQFTPVDRLRTATIRFTGVDPSAEYHVSWNGGESKKIKGSVLARDGLVIVR